MLSMTHREGIIFGSEVLGLRAFAVTFLKRGWNGF